MIPKETSAKAVAVLTATMKTATQTDEELAAEFEDVLAIKGSTDDQTFRLVALAFVITNRSFYKRATQPDDRFVVPLDPSGIPL